jgi:hypothetical protein
MHKDESVQGVSKDNNTALAGETLATTPRLATKANTIFFMALLLSHHSPQQ